MRSGKKIDMTQGSIMKLVLLFAIPICLGNVLQQLYNTVDTLIVGNFCDSIALAAVGTSSQPVEMLLCIFIGIGSGVSIIVSQCAGSGNTARMKEVVSTATTFLYCCNDICRTESWCRKLCPPEKRYTAHPAVLRSDHLYRRSDRHTELPSNPSPVQ